MALYPEIWLEKKTQLERINQIKFYQLKIYKKLSLPLLWQNCIIKNAIFFKIQIPYTSWWQSTTISKFPELTLLPFCLENEPTLSPSGLPSPFKLSQDHLHQAQPIFKIVNLGKAETVSFCLKFWQTTWLVSRLMRD